MKRTNINKFIDLHMHLDGAITVDIAKKLAKLQHIELPTSDDAELLDMLSVPENCRNLNDFLRCFDLPCSLIQTKEGISEAVYLVAENMKKQDIIYAEVRFAPQKCTDNGLTQEEAVVAALEGMRRSDLKMNLILCCMRGDDNEANKKANIETVEIAKRYLVDDGGVVAIDLAGAEGLFPNEWYMDIFALAKEYRIPFTIHAGEAAGAESVKTALTMGASRIGHGVRIADDVELLQMIKNNKIPLEMCPTSNSQTMAVDDMDTYPLIQYLDMGIAVTLNTDDPAIERTDIVSEYRYMETKFGLSYNQEIQLLNNAVDAAFTNEETKADLRKQLNE